MIRRGAVLLGVLVTALGLAATPWTSALASAAPTTARTVIYDCSGKASISPRTISSIFCGDAGVVVTDVTWPIWTDGGAVGIGTEHRKLCVPNCAAGRSAVYPVGIWLYAPVRGEFTRVMLYPLNGAVEQYQLTGTRR
ncbi:hypothetical protein GS4_08_01290 [Gordonia soli NBRC 108243]|uniref:Secreted protein n=1 Tax=Gordonia soli NBRC 108243 TaxID=1223545 RepID=M0QGG7_9ACTN|nr:hypothetical protein GS4_08_01290 [Gordonia soli NBRC 108243]